MKYKDLKQLNDSDREKKLKELKLELAKSKTGTGGKTKTKQIRKIIARVLTINSSKKEGLKTK
jgi:ribosomal protein L29